MPSVVQYPIDDIPRDSNPADKIDVAALRAWWAASPTNERNLYKFFDTEKTFWPANYPTDAWYIPVYSTLITCGRPADIVPLFKYLARDASEEQIIDLGARFKALLMKIFTIIGIPQVITAVSHLAKAELAAIASLHPDLYPGSEEEDIKARLNHFLSRDNQVKSSHYIPKDLDKSSEQKGFDFMLRIYRHNLPGIMSTWQHHQADFEWLQMRMIYGPFLSDHSILSDVETELVVLAGIMAQDVLAPTIWHVRGMKRLGVDDRHVDVALGMVKSAAKFARRELQETGYLRAKDVDVEWEPAQQMT